VNPSRVALLLAGGLAACALGALGIWYVFLRPAVEVSDLRPGERCALDSGLTFVLPEQGSGSRSHWRSEDPELNPHGFAEEVSLSLPAQQGPLSVGIDVYRLPQLTAERLTMLENGTHLAAASDDGTVQVRWHEPESGTVNVAVITQLPGSLPGYVTVSGSEASDAQAAFEVAREVWRLLSVTGVELPSPSL